jgi:2-succinyl-6-hydroxy-2,4-cyclohexadiene-1-carboxylate synthase
MTDPHLHYDVHAGDGPPTLFVHGIFAGRALWRENIEPLRTVCSPVVVELYGHGRSPSPAGADRYPSAAYVAEFERIRAQLGVERWWLVGHSLGAALTLRYSLEQPDRVTGQVFTNSMSGLADEQWQARMAIDADQHAKQIARGGLEGVRASPVNPARARRITPAVRDALAADEELLDPVGIANTVRWTAAAASVRSRLAAIRVPTMLIAGDREKAFIPHRDFVAQNLPGVVVENVSCGHSPNAERPADFNRLVEQFVRRPSADGGQPAR